jgi:hypothetical protein
VNGAGFSHAGANTSEFDWDGAVERLDSLQKMGAAWDRGDWWWHRIEPENGTFVWTDYDRAADEYVRRGIHVLPILCYDAAWHPNQSPNTDAYREQYGRFVYETVKHFKGRITAYEIWNEPNISIFWHPEPNVSDYTALLKVAYREAKRADPSVTVVGGAVAGMDWAFIEAMLKGGAGDAMDALSIHPYQGNLGSVGPEEGGLARDLRRLKALLKQYGHAEMPVWITEMGNRTVPDPSVPAGQPQPTGRVTETQQANLLVRSYAVALSEGVQRLFWFNLQDWTGETWGTMTANLRKKPSWFAYRQMSDALTGKEYGGTLSAWPHVSMPWFHAPAPGGGEAVTAVGWTDDAGEAIGILGLHGSALSETDTATGPTPRRAPLLTLPGHTSGVALNGAPVYIESRETALSDVPPGSLITPPVGVTVSPERVSAGDRFTLTVRGRNSDALRALARLPRGLVLTSIDSQVSMKNYVEVLGNDTYRLKGSVPPGEYNVGYAWVGREAGQPRRYTTTARLTVTAALSLRVVPNPVAGRDLTLTLTNHSSRATVAEVTAEMIGNRTDTISSVSLDPHQTRTFPVANAAADDAPLAAPLPVVASVHSPLGAASWAGSVYFWAAGHGAPGAPLMLDSAQQWQAENGGWSGADDLSAVVTARYDANALHLHADVTDDVFSQEFALGDVWKGDSIQLAVDPAWARRPDLSGAVEFGLALTPDGPQVYRWTPPAGVVPGATLIVNRRGNVASYEATIPWRELGISAVHPPQTMGFALVVNDNDGGRRDGWLAYGDGIATEKRSDRYGTLTLIK